MTKGADREPRGPRRIGRRVFGRELRTFRSRGQQYIFVGLAILFLVGWFAFRQSCSKRIGQTFGTVTDPLPRDPLPFRDGGVNSMKPRPRPMHPTKTDPDDW